MSGPAGMDRAAQRRQARAGQAEPGRGGSKTTTGRGGWSPRRVAALVAGVFVAFCLVLAAVVTAPGDDAAPTDPADPGAAAGPAELVREDSHVLGEPGSSGVTVVEFLDLECEACGAAYPVVEQLREDYAGEVTFVARFFPIDSHANAMNAALATQAAAEQGEFEAMYQRMYETQLSWGEQQQSHAPLFRSYAEDLGLDLERYDAAVADPATQARVEADRDDGLELGVQGTPTFFVDGELLQPESVEDFYTAIDAALAAR